MALEAATYISDLNASNPTSGDPKSQGDDHLRLVKSTVKATLPNLTGAMNATQTELNRFVGSLGVVVDRTYGEYTTNTDISTIIPLDDTIPQNTEGTQIISVSITPKSTTNRIRLRFRGAIYCNTTGINVTAAIFSSASANAVAADFVTTSGGGFAQPITIEKEYVPATTSALTFTVRVGSQAGVAFRLNGNTGRLFGGIAAATLVVEEIAV